MNLKAIIALIPVLILLVGVVRAAVDDERWIDSLRLSWGSESGQLVFDLIEPADMLDFVRTEATELNRNVFRLSDFLPSREVDDIEYRFLSGNFNDVDAATYRTYDTEAPIAGRQGAERRSGALPPISRKIRLGEEERLRQRALDRGDNSTIVDQLYNDAAQMVRAVQARLEMARGEALYSGKIVLNENGVMATIDFGRAAGHTVAPGTLWSNPAADILGDLLSWVETYVDTNGSPPGGILTSTTVVRDMLRNTGIRELAVSRAALDSVLSNYELPPLLQPYDVKVRVNGVATRVIPADRLILMPSADEPLGDTFYGVTAEALELREAGQIVADEAPGIVGVVQKTFDPVATWTKAAAIAVPVLGNPDLTFAADVR